MTTFIATCRIERRIKGELVVTEKNEEIELSEDEQATVPASALRLPAEAKEAQEATAAALAEKEAADKAAADKAAADKEAADKAAADKAAAKKTADKAGSDL